MSNPKNAAFVSGFAVLFIGLHSLVGHALGIRAMYYSGEYGMALMTAIGLMFAGTGIMIVAKRLRD